MLPNTYSTNEPFVDHTTLILNSNLSILDCGISASSQNQAFNALLFFYRDVLKKELGSVNSLRAKRPVTIIQCPSQEEVRQLLATVSDIYRYPTRLIVHLLYGCGLRVSEPLNLRIKDVDLKQGRLYIYQAKGNKGRVVLFPNCLAEALERQLVRDNAQATQDFTAGIPVALPGLLAKKYPSAARSARWAWLFPSHTTCRDSRIGKQVRWRCHEHNVRIDELRFAENLIHYLAAGYPDVRSDAVIHK